MKNYKLRFFFSLVMAGLVFASCKQEEMTKKDLGIYMRDKKNGVKQVVEKGELKVEVYLLRPELVSNLNFNWHSPTDSLRYFMVSFSKAGREALLQVGNMDQYAKTLNELSFGTTQSCFIVEAPNDTLRAVNSSFSNTYGTSSSNNLLLVFKSQKPQSECRLVLSEIGFGLGKSKFIFKEDDIKKFYNIKVTD